MIKDSFRKQHIGFFFLLFITFISCTNNTKEFQKNTNPDFTNNRKDALIQIALTGKWKSTDQEIQNELFSIFNDTYRTATNSIISMNKIDTINISIPVNSTSNRASIINELDTIDFDLYSIESNNNNLYAVTSDDIRVGNVLALVESEFSNDISDQPFSIMFAELLNNYVITTADEWNSITDNDISDFKTRSAYKDIINSGEYTYSNWEPIEGNTNYLLPTNWNQNPTPFNNCLLAVKGNNAYYIGCGAIQVAQIMAFHKFAKDTISPNLKLIKSKWALAKNWDGKYDFELLTSIKNPKSYSPEKFRVQLGAFLFDVAEGCKSNYSETGTGTTETNRLSYLLGQGYSYKSVTNYSFDNIKASIDEGCPVPICGQAKKIVTNKTRKFLWWSWNTTETSYSEGHAFIIDGYYKLSCTATNGINTIVITDNFIHCNPGWGGIDNGYFINGVFNFGVGALADDDNIRSIEGTDNYYQYKLSQINMLKP